MRVLLFLLLLSLTIDITSEIVVYNNHSNLWLFNLYTPLEYGIFGLIFLMMFKYTEIKKYYFIAYLIFFGLIGYFTITEFTVLSDIALGIESIFMIISSALYFYVMLSKLEYSTPLSNPFFWFNSAILIYFSGAFFVFIFSDYRDMNDQWNLWNIHSIVRIVFNLLLIIAFWKARKTTT